MSENLAVTGITNQLCQPVSTLFEDEEIKVLWHRGTSDFLLITFGDMVTLAQGDRFFADAPVKRLAINCIGFMSKRPNWFPVTSVAKALSEILPVISKFTKIVNYGGSMGGYAAIKYSRRTGATSTIAFCPQWTIDKKECNGKDPGYQQHYASYLDDMSITKHDISGDIYMLYDPDHVLDSFHASKILALGPSIKEIPTRSSDHHVTMILAGTSNLEQLIQLSLQNDLQGFSSLASQVRRAHPQRTRILLTKLSKRHPILLEKFLSGTSKPIGEYELGILNPALLSAFSKSRNYEMSICTLMRMSSTCRSETRRRLLEKAEHAMRDAALSAKHREIKSHHNCVIKYCAVSGTITHSSDGSVAQALQQHLPVFATPFQSIAALTIFIDGLPYYLMMVGVREVEPVDTATASADPSKIIAVDGDGDGDHFRLMSGNLYLTAEPGGVVVCNRSQAKAWETFQWL